MEIDRNITASLRDEETNLDGFEDSKPVSPL